MGDEKSRKMQRHYYIKGGIGFMKNARGERIPFEKGKIYIHPHNLKADFISDPEDPIDHIYYDFLSTPPIISGAPLVYNLPPNHTAISLIYAAEVFCSELAQKA